MSNENYRENYEVQPIGAIYETQAIGSGKTHSSGLRIWNEILRQEREEVTSMFAPIRDVSIARFEYLVNIELSVGFSKYPRCKLLNYLSTL